VALLGKTQLWGAHSRSGELALKEMTEVQHGPPSQHCRGILSPETATPKIRVPIV